MNRKTLYSITIYIIILSALLFLTLSFIFIFAIRTENSRIIDDFCVSKNYTRHLRNPIIDSDFNVTTVKCVKYQLTHLNNSIQKNILVDELIFKEPLIDFSTHLIIAAISCFIIIVYIIYIVTDGSVD